MGGGFGGFKGFRAGQTAALNTLKNSWTWPGCMIQDFVVGLKWLKIARFGSPTETLVQI